MFEERIQRMARRFPYPPTPVIVWQRRAAPRISHALRVLAIAVALGLVVMVTPLRAAVLEWLRVGVATILVGPTEEPRQLPALMNLFGATTLDNARITAGFPLQIPRLLGMPDHVYQQAEPFNTVIMVWNDPPVSLYQIGPVGRPYMKFTQDAEQVTVAGYPGVWMDLPHMLQYEQADMVTTEERFLVAGPVLIWYANDVTYRLETGMEQVAAIEIAESLGTLDE